MLVHANHFQAFVSEQLEETYRPFSPDSLYRVPRIERVLRRARSAATPEALRATIAEALGDHFGYPNSVCNHPMSAATRSTARSRSPRASPT